MLSVQLDCGLCIKTIILFQVRRVKGEEKERVLDENNIIAISRRVVQLLRN